MRAPSSDAARNAYPVRGWVSRLVVELAVAMVFFGMTAYRYFAWAKGAQVLDRSSIAAICALNEGARAAVGGIDGAHTMNCTARFATVTLNGHSTAMVLFGECANAISRRGRPKTAVSVLSVDSDGNGLVLEGKAEDDEAGPTEGQRNGM
ncbi:hypothetical protein MKZ38_007804 [Zalerion maritima]|uniref:Uncharacterized protein n=1 Tax=Zalerion maritima TaxID=339359 RepID=A0AAD5RIF7_9PEZI|nr:hypothetical protein MKZ38_007804 [Zalerion maritima]